MIETTAIVFCWVLIVGLVVCLIGFGIFMGVCIISAINDLRERRRFK